MLNAQSDCTESSEGRKLPFSKKLSKAISCIPRSRFQKPRPNLPGSKRPDSSSLSAAARKSVETSQNKNDNNASELNKNESLQNGCNTETTTSKPVRTVQEPENKDAAVPVAVCPFEKTDNFNAEVLAVKETSQNEESKSNSLLNADVKLTKEVDSTPKLSTDETFAKADEGANLTKELISEDRNTQTPVLKAVEFENDQTSITEKAVAENANCKENAEITVNVEETSLEEENRNTAVLSTESLPNPSEQDKSAANVPPSVTDRNSKYPHLTSILLSKKRTEPKKEIQQKRRRKFRKGETLERSTMKMIDLIYWNPTKTDECTAKRSATTVDEAPASTNVEEEECIDEDQAENNLQGAVPQLVVSEDGQINLDASSLIVSRNAPKPIVSEVIVKDETTYSSFRKRPLTKHWSAKDTTIFYKALSLVGTDFGLMEKIFPHRTRRELKQKFKREEKYNIDLINRAMYESQLTFDAHTLEDLIEHLNNLPDVNSENVDDFEPSGKGKKRSLNGRQKAAKKMKSATTELSDSATESLPSEGGNKTEKSNKRKRKTKKLPEDFLDVDDIENEIELTSEETNSIKEDEEKHKKKKRRRSKSLSSDLVDTDVIDEVTEIVCETSNEGQYIEVSFSKNVENNEGDNELTTCIPVEYVEDIDSVTNCTLLNDVMAYEVVTSQTPLSKRKNNTSKVLQKNQTLIPVTVLSSTNYTPA